MPTDKSNEEDVAHKLFHAALYRKPEIVRELHKKGLLNKTNGEKALYYAARFDAVKIAETLIECGISPVGYMETDNSSERVTLLGTAAKYGSENMVKWLLKPGVNVDDYSPAMNWTPLRNAIIHIGDEHKPNPNIVKMLLEHGADIKKIDSRSWASFSYSGDADELELLLQHGLSPNIDAEGEPLLSRVLYKPKLALKLIEHGADVHYVKDGQTYLHRVSDLEVTKALIAKGLNVGALDQQGRTPVECCNKGYIKANADCIEAMVTEGASIAKLSITDRIVLASIPLIKKLMSEKKVDFSVLNEQGKTPLRILAEFALLDHNLKSMEYVLNNVSGIDVNQTNPMGGWTALHESFANNEGHVNFNDAALEDKHVAENNNTKATDLLIAHGAKPLKDKSGRTPLMCLTFNGFSSSYNQRVIERYYRFEAQYYGVDPEIYKKELYKLRAHGFRQVRWQAPLGLFESVTMVPKDNALEEFWRNVDMSKKSVLENVSGVKLA